MASDYTRGEINDMKETFYFFDKDGNGLIPALKVGTVMRFLGHNLKDADIQNLLGEVNITNDGKINFIAFLKIMNMMKMKDGRIGEIEEQRDCAWCKTWAHVSGRSRQKITLERRISRCHAKSRLCEAFSDMDLTDKGYVSASGLKQKINSSKQPMTFAVQGELEKMIQDLDVDGDDKISYPEFINLMTSNNTRRRRSLKAILHAATFSRRMEKIYKKMDPLQPSPSEEALFEKLQNNPTIPQGKSDQAAKHAEPNWREIGVKWSKLDLKSFKDQKSVQLKNEVDPDYSFAQTFSRLFTIKKFQRKASINLIKKSAVL